MYTQLNKSYSQNKKTEVAYRTIAQNFYLLFNHSIAVFVQEASALVLDIVGKVVDNVSVRAEARFGEMLALFAALVQLFGPGTV